MRRNPGTRVSLQIEQLDNRELLTADFAAAAAIGDNANHVALDAAGNAYITGTFTGTKDFDPGPDTFELTSSNTSIASFVVKFENDGDFAWASMLNPSGAFISAISKAVAVDALGNVYAVGTFDGTADFDPGPGGLPLSSTDGSTDGFIWKLDNDGNLDWARVISGSLTEQPNELAVHAGGIYITGSFSGTPDFDPGVGIVNLSAGAEADTFVARYNTNGELAWARGMSGNSNRGNGIFVNESGVYTTGAFSGTVDFDPGIGVSNLISSGGQDIFVSKLSKGGSFGWAQSMGGESNDSGNGIVVDQSGNVLTTGFFIATADFDPGPGTLDLTGVGVSDTFVSKLDSSGDFVWARKLGNNEGNAITVDLFDNVYATGGFSGTSDFDPGPNKFNLTSAGGLDVFVSKLSASGDFAWARNMGGTDTEGDQGRGIAVNPATKEVYTVGVFHGAADLDPGPGESILNADPGGFISRLIQNDPPIVRNPISDFEAKEDGPTTILDLSETFFDSDAGDSLTLTVSGNSDPGLLTASLVGTSLLLDYQPNQAGQAKIVIRATDTAGNFVEDVFVVIVLTAVEQIVQINSSVDELHSAGILSDKEANSLRNSLDQAIDRVKDGKPKQAIDELKGFKDRVNDFISQGILAAEDGQPLLDATNCAMISIALPDDVNGK